MRLLNFKSISKTLLAAILLSAVMISCTKKNDYVVPDISGLNVIHASPTAEKLDFYVGTQKATTEPFSDFTFGTKFGYLNAYSGIREVTISKKDSSAPLLTDNIKLEPEIGYSLFIVDKLENVKFLLLQDDLTLPPPGKARVRFVNLSPDAPALNLNIQGATTDLFTNKAFKEYSTFENIDAGSNVTFNVKNAAGEIETKIDNVNIEAGKIYTVWVKGLIENTDDYKLGIAVFTH